MKMCWTLIVVAALELGGVTPAAESEVLRLDRIEEQTDLAGVSDGSAACLVIPVKTIPADVSIRYAELLFHASLPIGTEVELWVRDDPAELPWEAEEPGTPQLWIVDERTESQIRFDITEFVTTRLGLREALSIVVRVNPRNDASTQLEFEKGSVEVLCHYVPRGRN